MSEKKNKSFNLEPGDLRQRSPNSPMLEVVGEGADAYLWIGNNADDDKACYATLGGRADLRKLAQEILARLDSGDSTPT